MIRFNNNRRYWLRYKLENSSEFGIAKSFYFSGTTKFLLNDSFSLTKQNLINLTKIELLCLFQMIQ